MKMTRNWIANNISNFMANVTLWMWKQNWIDCGYSYKILMYLSKIYLKTIRINANFIIWLHINFKE
jgi:hypothetical protein